jgi:hypothetical protein
MKEWVIIPLRPLRYPEKWPVLLSGYLGRDNLTEFVLRQYQAMVATIRQGFIYALQKKSILLFYVMAGASNSSNY